MRSVPEELVYVVTARERGREGGGESTPQDKVQFTCAVFA